jgi:hypothetical protein
LKEKNFGIQQKKLNVMEEKNTRKTVIHEELNEKQQEIYDEWLSHIKAIYGEYGLFTWKITPNGIGNGIVVYSHHTKTELDLTDTDSW